MAHRILKSALISMLTKELSSTADDKPEETPEIISPFLAALEQAVETGTFELRNSLLGKRWYKQISQDLVLKQMYEKCPNRESQQVFRKAWAGDQWKQEIQKREEKASEEEKHMPVVAEHSESIIRRWI